MRYYLQLSALETLGAQPMKGQRRGNLLIFPGAAAGREAAAAAALNAEFFCHNERSSSGRERLSVCCLTMGRHVEPDGPEAAITHIMRHLCRQNDDVSPRSTTEFQNITLKDFQCKRGAKLKKHCIATCPCTSSCWYFYVSEC